MKRNDKKNIIESIKLIDLKLSIFGATAGTKQSHAPSKRECKLGFGTLLEVINYPVLGGCVTLFSALTKTRTLSVL